MRLSRLAGGILLAVLAGLCPARAADNDVGPLIKELQGPTRAIKRTPAQYDADYARALAALLPEMSSDDLGRQSAAQQPWQEICLRAGRPKAEVERAAACKAMVAKLGANIPVRTRVWMLKQIERIGRAECVAPVAALLNDSNELVRTRALAALTNLPVPAAGDRIRAALAASKEPAWSAALIAKLGFRREPASVAAITRCLADPEPAVADAAAFALGTLGTPEAATALVAARKTPLAPSVRRTVDDAVLRCADALALARKPDAAAVIYQGMMEASQPVAIRVAALRGLALLGRPNSLPTVFAALEDPDPTIQTAASRALVQMPGKEVTRQAAATLKDLKPTVQVLVIRALGDRGDEAACAAVCAQAASKDEAVRTAAVTALGGIGEPSVVPVLACCAVKASGSEAQAAHASLVRLRARGADGALVAACKTADVETRTELIQCLSERGAKPAAGALLGIAAKDPDASVRVAALDALGALAGARQLEGLLGLLAAAKSDAERAAVQRALTEVVTRVSGVETRAKPVLAAYSRAAGPVQRSLLTLMGRTGSPKALAILRDSLNSPTAEVKDAAVQGLAVWPDAAVTPDLLALARGSNAAYRDAAFAGYVRIAGQPSQRPAAQTARLYAEILPVAQSKEEKEAVVAGLADVAAPETLGVLEPMIADPDVSGDAGAALMKVATAVAKQSPEARQGALVTLKRLASAATDEKARKPIGDVIDSLTREEDWIGDWLMSPIYRKDGVEGNALDDAAWAPEKPAEAASVQWKPLPADKKSLWSIDLQRLPGSGDERVLYLRTRVQSPRAQDVEMQIGSDDGVKVWLNGTQVHQWKGSRGLNVGSDRAKVSLKEGGNDVLVEVMNHKAQYAFGMRFRTLDHDHVEGLTFKAE